MNTRFSMLAAIASLAVASGGRGEESVHHHGGSSADSRVAVAFPAPLRAHTLENMRDHLLTLQRIQDALARDAYDDAAQLAESRLGLSSLEAHGAHEVARYMPRGMQDIGVGMHRAGEPFRAGGNERRRHRGCPESARRPCRGHFAMRGLPRRIQTRIAATAGSARS